MVKSIRRRRLWDAYRFPGFAPEAIVRGFFGDPHGRILALRRRAKKRSAANAAKCAWAGTIGGNGKAGICPTARCVCTCGSRYDAFAVVAAKIGRAHV